MPALSFPSAPTTGQRFPINPGVTGQPQWEYDGSKWTIVPSVVSLGPANQGSFNNYKWPIADGLVDQVLTTDGTGNLSWSPGGTTSGGLIKALSYSGTFNGATTTFDLVEMGTTQLYSPVPSTNIVVFLGGIPQNPNTYTIGGAQPYHINFSTAPPTGTSFYAITLINSNETIQQLSVDPAFDGTSQTYSLVEAGTTVLFAPVPYSNIVVFLGGVPQNPNTYVVGSGAPYYITFSTPPPVGTNFYAISTR